MNLEEFKSINFKEHANMEFVIGDKEVIRSSIEYLFQEIADEIPSLKMTTEEKETVIEQYNIILNVVGYTNLATSDKHILKLVINIVNKRGL